MKTIFIAVTPYQLFTIFNIRNLNYTDKKCILILSGSLIKVKLLYNKIKDLDLFEQIYALPDNLLDNARHCIQIKWVAKMLLRNYLKNDNLLKQISNVEDIYFANVGGIAVELAELFKRCNSKIKIKFFEDGAITYSKYIGSIIHSKINNSNLIKKILFYFFPHVLSQIDEFYVYCPQLVLWNCSAKVQKLPTIFQQYDKLKYQMNYIYNYSDMEDSYNEKVIFFEESYFKDGIQVNDLEVVKQLEEQYGKDNIFIKIHPRNKTNRFKELGYKTNINTDIPWEVIAMNIDINNKILATMTSTAVINSFLLFATKGTIKFNYEKMNLDDLRISSTVSVVKKLQSLFPEIVN